MRTRTKIICTIGPAVDSVEKMMQLIVAGMNTARINFSHGTHAEHLQTINRLKEAREKAGSPLAIMLDTKGPEIRVGEVKDGKIAVSAGMRLKLVAKFSGKADEISVAPFSVFETVNIGHEVLFNDGYVVSRIVAKSAQAIEVEIENSGEIANRKGVNIPDVDLNLPALTEADIADIKFGCANDIDLIAASFIRSAEHVLLIKKLLAAEGHSDVMVIAKIENSQGIANFDAILEVADGIMVARGDLGVEVKLAMVPKLQKLMIRKCYQACKPVVTATQMLESMINNPRPTRAEVSDVANAIYDSTSSVMLSAETAIGKYAIETVKQMKRIIEQTEDDFDYINFFKFQNKVLDKNISSAVAAAAVKTAYNLKASALFVYTSSGFTARLISGLRPAVPIVALTSKKKIYHQLAFIWGVVPTFAAECKNEEQAFAIMDHFAKKAGVVKFGDLVVTTAGVPFGRRGSTNMMVVENIGNIQVRGKEGAGKEVSGEIVIIYDAGDYKPEAIKGKIIVIPRCEEEYFPLLLKAGGVIMQHQQGDSASEKLALDFAKKHNLSMIVQADNAMTILTDGQTVVLNPAQGLVYR